MTSGRGNQQQLTAPGLFAESQANATPRPITPSLTRELGDFRLVTVFSELELVPSCGRAFVVGG